MWLELCLLLCLSYVHLSASFRLPATPSRLFALSSSITTPASAREWTSDAGGMSCAGEKTGGGEEERSSARRRVLVVTDSPAKSSTIRQVLEAHDASLRPYRCNVMTCPESVTTLAFSKHPPRSKFNKQDEVDFSVALDSAISPQYKVIDTENVREPLREIQRALASNITNLVLALNSDKRGDFGAWSLMSVLNIPKTVSLHRLRLSELTPRSIPQSLKSTLSDTCYDKTSETLIDKSKVDGEIAQRVLDRTISLSVSQAMFKSLGGYFNAGRVQSKAMDLIVERDRLIDHIKRNPSYFLRGHFTLNSHNRHHSHTLCADLCAINGCKLVRPNILNSTHIVEVKDDELILSDKEQADCIAQLCELPSTTFKVDSIESSLMDQSPPRPLNTTSMLTLSEKFLHFAPEYTLKLAKSLYDKGIITYPNTDASEFGPSERNFISAVAVKRIGKEYVNMSSFSTGGDIVEIVSPGPIRPVFESGDLISPLDLHLEGAESKLFDLILKNTLAAVMLPARRRVTNTILAASLSSDELQKVESISKLQIPKIGPQILKFNSTRTVVERPGFLTAFVPRLIKSTNSCQGDSKQNLADFVGQKAYLKFQPDDLSKFDRSTYQSIKPIRHFRDVRRFSTSKILEKLAHTGIIDGESLPSTLKTLDFLENKGLIRINAKENSTKWNRVGTTEKDITPTQKGFFIVNYLRKHFNFLLHPLFSPTVRNMCEGIIRKEVQRDEVVNNFIFGSNSTSSNDVKNFGDSLSIFLEKGLFRSIGELLRRKIYSDTYTKELENIPHTSNSHFLGKHPVTKLSVKIRSGRYGNYLQIGNDDDPISKNVKRFSLPDWLTPSYPISSAEEALTFSELPQTLFQCASTNEPVILLMSKGLLHLQLGEGKSAMSRRVPLEPGIFPGGVTKKMALNKLYCFMLDSTKKNQEL